MTLATPTSRNVPATATTRSPDLDEAFGERLRSRDPETTERFIDSQFGLIYGRVRGLVGNTPEAEDLTQDILLKIHRALPRFDPKKKPEPWVSAITMNHLRDHWRSRRLLRDADLELETPSPVASEQPPSDLERQERADVIKQAVHRLPFGMRSVLSMRIYEGRSFEAIADLLNLTPATARKRYSRALGLLRDSIALQGALL